MVYNVEELLELVDSLRERGVTHFRTESLEFSMEPEQPQPLLSEGDVEIEHTPGSSAEELLYYSAT
tara:strand:- start:3308 stop:3505 length:198 start_codon:yes stop_codon:yes gene_type:complete